MLRINTYWPKNAESTYPKVKNRQQTSNTNATHIGRVSVFQVAVLVLMIVMLGVGVYLYLPSNSALQSISETPSSNDTVERLDESLPSNSKNPLTEPEVTPEVSSSTLGYCADKDLEVIGYEWDRHLATAKTRSANSKNISADNVAYSPSYYLYLGRNQESQYANYDDLFGQSIGLEGELDHSLLLEISRTREKDISALNAKYAGNKRYLATVLGSFDSKFGLQAFNQILDSHDHIDNDFLFRVFSSGFQTSLDYIAAIIAKTAGAPALSSDKIDQGNQLLFTALSNGNFDYIPYILDMDINFVSTQNASLYFALTQGANRTSDSNFSFLELQKRIEAIVGPPSFNDLISISLHTKENVLDKLVEYGLNIEDHLDYAPNPDIRDMSDDAINEKLNRAREKWPFYILRINPNSDCMSASEFHWTSDELTHWYTTRVKSDDDFALADKELAAISRLYVERAHMLYYAGALALKPKEFRVDEDRVFFEDVLGTIFQADNNTQAGEELGRLSAEINSQARQDVLRFYIISLVRSLQILDLSTNLGFMYNENDMITAVRAKNKDAVEWLLKNGIDLGGADALHNGILKWLIVNKTPTYLSPVQLDNLPDIHNPLSLSAHELHYLQCQSYGAIHIAFRRSEIGKDVKQQVNTVLCEKLSGYQKAIAAEDF